MASMTASSRSGLPSALLLLALAACAPAPVDRSADERAVLGAIIDGVSRFPGDSAVPIVLEGRFVRPSDLGSDGAPAPDSLVGWFVDRLVADSLPRALARELARVAQSRDSISLPLPTQRLVVFDTVLTYGPPPPKIETARQLERFKLAYKPFPTLFGVSHVAFSRNGDSAAVYVQTFCDLLCGGGEITVLQRTAQGWKVTRSVRLWIA